MNAFKIGALLALIQLVLAGCGFADTSNTIPNRENSESARGLRVVPPKAANELLLPPVSVAKARKIDPAAKPLIEVAQKSYQNLKRADLSGNFSVTVRTTGVVHSVVRSFSSSFERPNKFRHQMKPNILLGCDGAGGYAYDKQENSYLRFQYPNTNQFRLRMPAGVLSTLLLQNPSLLFALSETRILDAMEGFGDVKKIEDRMIDGAKCPALQFGEESDQNQVQIAFDPATHLIRQFVLSIKSDFAQGGEILPGIAAIVVDYKAISPQPSFSEDHFAWTPPPGAQNILEAAGAEP